MERRRALSPALVQPFMRAIMEAQFPAPGRTITIKTFLPGSGTEVSDTGGYLKQKLKPEPSETLHFGSNNLIFSDVKLESVSIFWHAFSGAPTLHVPRPLSECTPSPHPEQVINA